VDRLACVNANPLNNELSQSIYNLGAHEGRVASEELPARRLTLKLR
jgi:hypothetical protein